MTARRLVVRTRANRDIEAAVDFYRDDGGPRVALAFVEALERAFRQIQRNPSGGSPRYAQELDLPGLRHCLVRRFPYLIFYAAEGRAVDVLRVVHAQRDIPERLRTGSGSRDRGGERGEQVAR